MRHKSRSNSIKACIRRESSEIDVMDITLNKNDEARRGVIDKILLCI